MEDFDLRKYLAKNRLLEDKSIKDQITPRVDKLITTSNAKSTQFYNIVKKEFNQENAEKALKVSKNFYTKLKNLSDKATSDPEKLRDISRFIPKIKDTVFFGTIGSIYEIVSGFDFGLKKTELSPEFFGKELFNIDVPTGADPTLGDPSIWIYISAILISLKIFISILSVISKMRKGVGAIKSIFKEDDTQVNIKFNFSDVTSMIDRIK